MRSTSASAPLTGPRLVLRPGVAGDEVALHQIRCQDSVREWWGVAHSAEHEIAAELRGDSDEVLYVIEVNGEIAGSIQYAEENEPDYRSAGIDIYLGLAHQGRRLGTEAIAILAAYLIDGRGHHRLTIDPAVANTGAIRSYDRVGFRPVGVMRSYERAPDGTWRDALLMDLLADELIRAK